MKTNVNKRFYGFQGHGNPIIDVVTDPRNKATRGKNAANNNLFEIATINPDSFISNKVTVGDGITKKIKKHTIRAVKYLVSIACSF